MRKYVVLCVALIVLALSFGATARQKTPNDFAANSLPRLSFYSRTQQVERWGWNGHAGHGGGVEAAEHYDNIAVLFHPASNGCWIGNVEAPHNWTPATATVCQ